MLVEFPHPAVKHVVVLMLEGRAFDHLMGWLYGPDEQPRIDSRPDDERPFLGLSTLEAPQLQALANPLPRGGGSVQPQAGARSPAMPAWPAGDGFAHVMNQTWGVCEPHSLWHDAARRQALLQRLGADAFAAAPMTGCLQDYGNTVFQRTGQALDRQQLSQALDTYLPQQLPVLSGLARFYGVCDEWFSSVPGQGDANRAFALAGTSRGMVDDGFYGTAGDAAGSAGALPMSTRSLFEVLEQFGLGWRVYWQRPRPPGKGARLREMFPLLADPAFDDRFVRFEATDPRNAFFEAARRGGLPALTWLEPAWSAEAPNAPADAAAGNGMGAGGDLGAGEDFVMDVYNALSASPAWNHTLLIITFDCGGGTYDHLPPPPALPSANDRVPLPGGAAAQPTMDAAARTQFGFDFAQLGPRVPMLLVSPRVGPSVVFRSRGPRPFDHACIAATILEIARIDRAQWQLGERVAQAATFEHLLSRPPRAIADPVAALGAADQRLPAPPLAWGGEYVLEFVGDPWFEQAGARYLGAPLQRGSGLHFPLLTQDPRQARRFRLLRADGAEAEGPVLNMSELHIATTESPQPGLTLLCVGPQLPWAYYARDASYEGAQWQLCLLGSRDPRQEVQLGDLVCLVSRLPAPARGQPPRAMPAPPQRLQPHPDASRHLSTGAGQWALWRVVDAAATPPS